MSLLFDLLVREKGYCSVERIEQLNTVKAVKADLGG